MTETLKRAVLRAEQLAESKQNLVASAIYEKVEELLELTEAEAIARLAEGSFAVEWDRDEDSIYDDWRAHYGLSEG